MLKVEPYIDCPRCFGIGKYIPLTSLGGPITGELQDCAECAKRALKQAAKDRVGGVEKV